jgi:hypothetical protein
MISVQAGMLFDEMLRSPGNCSIQPPAVLTMPVCFFSFDVCRLRRPPKASHDQRSHPWQHSREHCWQQQQQQVGAVSNSNVQQQCCMAAPVEQLSVSVAAVTALLRVAHARYCNYDPPAAAAACSSRQTVHDKPQHVHSRGGCYQTGLDQQTLLCIFGPYVVQFQFASVQPPNKNCRAAGAVSSSCSSCVSPRPCACHVLQELRHGAVV